MSRLGLGLGTIRHFTMAHSYPPPPSPRPTISASYPPLLPIYPPPPAVLALALPKPPPPPRPFPDPRYIVSTHLVPSAHLRCTPPAPAPPPPEAPASASKAERAERNSARVKWVEAQAEAPRGRYERVQWSAVNRYVRRDSPHGGGGGGGLTLFFAHANGFPKEIWEPTMLELLATPAAARDVEEIWTWEAAHHGASCVLNMNLGMPMAAVDWSDDARDVLNFLLHFLPSEPGGALPGVLTPVPAEESALRKVRGFTHRRLLAVGHSFGGCCCTWAALTHPRLFAALTLVDPVMVRFGPAIHPGAAPPPLAAGAVARRATWPSRDAAHASFKAHPFFSTWDPRVLALYVARGLVEDEGGEGQVKLAMPPLQEALVFAGTVTSGAVWDLLPQLEGRVPLRWVVPGKPGHPEIGGPDATRERVWRRPANSSNVRIPEAGHLIAQEAPKELAREIAGVVDKLMSLEAKL